MAFYGGSYMNVSLEKEHSKHFLRTTMCMHTGKKKVLQNPLGALCSQKQPLCFGACWWGAIFAEHNG